MQWLVALELENDSIVACRLMNIFRRKGVKIGTLNLASRPEGYSLLAVVESPEADVEHIFHFLRSTAGVRHVDSYRHQPSEDASFLFVDAADSSSVAKILETFHDAQLLFASQGKYLLEVPAESSRKIPRLAEAGWMPFARVRSTRDVPEAVTAGAR